MASAALELQKAIFAALSADGPLVSLLGGPRVYDDVPRGAAYPYVAFGQMSLRDWSTATDTGEEHAVTLHIWSEASGHRQAHRIASALRECLNDVAPALLDGHRLVNLQHETTELRREAGGERYRGFVRFRAVTEVAA